MEQYIPKSAVVAEIERKHNQEVQWMERQGYNDYNQGLRDGYANILSSINTLETKDIDSESLDEKAIAKYLYEKKGYPITLNGNLPSYEETMKDANQYMIYKKEQLIKKMTTWLNNCFITHDEYGVISTQFDTEEEMFEDFKKYIEG